MDQPPTATQPVLAASADASTTGTRRWRALAVILSAAFLVGFDFFVVNIAIPSIELDLRASFAQIQLVIASYGFTYAVLLISGGRLGDIYGRKRMFMLGVAGFVVTSLGCGLAPGPNSLIAARALQGITGALLFPQVLSIMQVTFSGKERAAAFGLFGMVIGLASFSGNVIGGLLVYANLLGLSWRPIFLINLPIGLITLWAAARSVEESRSATAKRLDIFGVLLVSCALSMLLYPLIEGPKVGWPMWTYLSVAASAMMLMLFIRFEKAVASRGGSPLVDMHLFHDKIFVTGLIGGVFFFSSAAAFFLVSTVFLQNGLGYSARDAGLTFASFAAAFLSSSLSSVRVQKTLGSRIINLGAALMIIGLLLLLWLTARYGAGTTGLELAPALVIYGTGQGFVMPTLISTILMNIDSEDAGSASGVLTTIQQLSFATGVAVIGTIFFAALGPGIDVGSFLHALQRALTVNVCLLAATFGLILRIPRFPFRGAKA